MNASANPIAERPCTCVRCGVCNGSGSMWVDYRGHAIAHGFDVTDDLVTCEECYGDGISEECDRCRDVRERGEWQDEDYAQ